MQRFGKATKDEQKLVLCGAKIQEESCDHAM